MHHLARHGLTDRRVLDIFESEDYVALRNKKGVSGQVKVIGADFGGQIWTVILAETAQRGIWRPVTGWPAPRGETTIYRTEGEPVAHRISAKHSHPDQAELVQTLRTELPSLRERYAVRTLALFGSYARGTARVRSDLDLLVEFDRIPGLLKFVQLEQYLTDLIGVKVDLVMKDALKPTIGRRILAEQVPV